MLCMALGLALSVQTAMVSVEKSLHSMGGDHVANAVAGPVFYVDHAYDTNHEHGQADADPDTGNAHHHHHHFIDSPLTMSWGLGDPAPVRFTAVAMLAPADTSLAPETSPGGLDRPPKRI